MIVQLFQKTASDQENYSLVCNFDTEDQAIAYMKDKQLEGLYMTVIQLHKFTNQMQTVSDLNMVIS